MSDPSSAHAHAPSPTSGLTIVYPRELPISGRAEGILEALGRHQVVIVAGATGSGKTTQLPKVALQAYERTLAAAPPRAMTEANADGPEQQSNGKGKRRHGGPQRPTQVGITQPRRIAATSVAARVASELRCELGKHVGYQIRFEDRSGADTRLKFMTDGILLAELQGDPLLRRYHTLIIDEAHERSLTIDFLLGSLKQILKKRPELKLIISSATIETERFAEFFGGAPVIQVEGRTFPVDVLYEPPARNLELSQAVADAVESIVSLDPQGDLLVFLPGEREIADSERVLRGRRLKGAQLLPLFGRLSAAEQSRVFSPGGARRVILATNVAETSLTIPGIVYVVDTGIARLSRYDPRTGTTRLHIEKISQASANQRKGRSGRVRDGICVRLFAEEDFDARPAFTDPEVRRVGLAGVILRMKSARLGEIENFPFLDPPQSKAVAEGYRVLEELGALDGERNLTALGKRLARFPVDPRIARMILAGSDNGCLDEVLIIAAALEIRDPRERPRDAEQKAAQLHRRFRDEDSDFTGLLKLWDFANEARAQSNAHLRRVCKENYLSFARIREWREVHRQLSATVRELKLRPSADNPPQGAAPKQRTPGQQGAPTQQRAPKQQKRPRENARGTSARGKAAKGNKANQASDTGAALHRALLSGLLSRIGHYDAQKRNYAGARQTRFAVHPSSALAKKTPAWIMAFELVETSRLFARTVAKVEPDWLDEVGNHLLQRRYSEPHWSEKSARASVREHATLYGLPVLKDRSVDYATVAPGPARLIFLEHALVRGEYQSSGDFQEKNRDLLAELGRLRDKARRSDMLADDDTLLTFFDERVPRSVVNGKTFEDWRKQAEKSNPELLCLAWSDVLAQEENLVPEDYPDELTIAGVTLPLSYRFDPLAENDGITLRLPLALVPRLQADALDWTIPAWHERRLLELLQRLSKAHRKQLGEQGQPAALPELASALAARLTPFQGPFIDSLLEALEEITLVRLPADAFRTDLLPGYLRLNCQIESERGRVLAEGRDLQPLLEEFGAQAREAIQREHPPPKAQRELRTWSFGELPRVATQKVLGTRVDVYPALVDRGHCVELGYRDSDAAAVATSIVGVHRLISLDQASQLAQLQKTLPGPFTRRAGLPVSKKDKAAFTQMLLGRIVCEAFPIRGANDLPRDRAAFDALLKAGTPRLRTVAAALCRGLQLAAADLDATWRALDAASKQPSGARAIAEMHAQLELLYADDLILEAPLEQLEHFPRYHRALRVRLERAVNNPPKDAQKLEQFTPVWEAFLAKRKGATDRAASIELRWDFEELRVAVFAPELPVARRVNIDGMARRVAALS